MFQIIRRYRWITLAGFVFGVIAPFIGLYVGLVHNVTIGTVLTLPWIALSAIMDQGMLQLPVFLRIAAIVLSGIMWSFLFVVIAALFR
jgi:hypothetical protein